MKGNVPGETEGLLDLLQSQTLRYFTDFAHPACGMALDRSVPGPYGPDAVAVGGSGFGIMALLVGVERGWLTRSWVIARLEVLLSFLERADRFHGAFPHFLDGRTGRAAPRFMFDDDGGDLCRDRIPGDSAGSSPGNTCPAPARPSGPFAGGSTRCGGPWNGAGTRRAATDTLYWHWSPRVGFARRFPIRGWNECLVTYVLAAASPTWPVARQVY